MTLSNVPDSPPDHADPRPLNQRLLPRFLSDAKQPWPLYVLKGWLLTLLPSIALSLLVATSAGTATGPEFGPAGPLLIFLLVVFAPVTETLIMTPPLLILNRLLGPDAAVIGSALLWGVLHSLAAPTWGLVVWWPFLVFSAVILFWRSQGRTLWGMLLVMLIHALQNAVPALSLVLS
jgi:hypothetical protein